MILHIRPHPRQIANNSNPRLLQQRSRTHPAPLQNVRGVHPPRTQNNLLIGPHSHRRSTIRGSPRLNGDSFRTLRGREQYLVDAIVCQ